jgi:hypothetical protein
VLQFQDCFPCAYSGRCDTGKAVSCTRGQTPQKSAAAALNAICDCTQIGGPGPTVEASSIDYMGTYTDTGDPVQSCATNSPGT